MNADRDVSHSDAMRQPDQSSIDGPVVVGKSNRSIRVDQVQLLRLVKQLKDQRAALLELVAQHKDAISSDGKHPSLVEALQRFMPFSGATMTTLSRKQGRTSPVMTRAMNTCSPGR